MLEANGVSKSYERSLTLFAGIGVTPLRTRHAVVIESSGSSSTTSDDNSKPRLERMVVART